MNGRVCDKNGGLVSHKTSFKILLFRHGDTLALLMISEHLNSEGERMVQDRKLIYEDR